MSGSASRSDYTFAAVPRADIPRSVFNRDHCYKTTMNSNALVPFFVDEALPGDTFNCRVHIFARLATPIVPIMDNLYCDVFFFAVPNRILWTHWVNMMGEQANPGDSTSYTVPQVTVPAGAAEATIWDYMGLPTKLAGSYTVSALPLRAYNKIWNRWFRDQNLQNAVPENTGDGPDASTDYVIKSRGKRHDYFTSCLPWPQKFTAPTLSITGLATVSAQPSRLLSGAQTPVTAFYKTAGATPASNASMSFGAAAGNMYGAGTGASGQVDSVYFANLAADLATSGAGFTINAMRQAFQIQKMLERDARGGTRYPEKILAHFGVTNPDMRMQYPEFLGGGTIPIIINPVAQTGPIQRVEATGVVVTGSTPQGNLAGFGVANGGANGFTKSFTEHMTILGLMQIRADLSYQQGLHRMWTRQTQYDFYWPALSHLGEQAVLSQELYAATPGAGTDITVFGYQERWAEYRYKPSMVTGLFRSNATGTLDFWHLSQKFLAPQTLNDTFIQDAPPLSRVVAVPTQPFFLVDSYIQLRTARPMPLYSVPGLIDHF